MTTPSEARLPRLAYTVQETAEILGLSHKSVRELIWRGELRHKRLSDRPDGRGRIIVPASEIVRWLEAS